MKTIHKFLRIYLSRLEPMKINTIQFKKLNLKTKK